MSFREVRYTSADGLTLYARDHGPVVGGATPLLCLPGLTRNSADFEDVAERLSPSRRVISPDFRGRGLSQYASDPMTYRPDVEMADMLLLMDRLSIAKAAIIGTSRGGIVAMLMAAKVKERLAGICFNDIGPRVGKAGLLRIRSYLGTDPQFTSWDEAVEVLKATNPGFEALDEKGWQVFARRIFRDSDGTPRANYDANLTAAFPSSAEIEQGKSPELWGFFDQVNPLPALVIRGANSDLLDEMTVQEMKSHHPTLATATVPHRGHVPFLTERESVEAIDRWLTEVDSARLWPSTRTASPSSARPR